MTTKVLITGASGFIGGHILRRLVSLGKYQVYGLGRTDFINLTNLPIDSRQYIKVDLSILKNVVFDADICIHVAGLADDRAPWSTYLLQNVEATKNLLAALPGCRLFVLISSSSVYDFSDGKPKQEQDAKLSNNLSMYGRSKLMAEKLVEREMAISSRYILRPRAVYGAGDRVLMPRIQQLIWKCFLLLPGNLKVLSSLTAVDLLAKTVEEVIKDFNPAFNIINVADPEPYLLRHKFEEVGREIAGKHLYSVVLPMQILTMLAKILHFLKIPSNLSPQALGYLSTNSVLDTTRLQEFAEATSRISGKLQNHTNLRQ